MPELKGLAKIVKGTFTAAAVLGIAGIIGASVFNSHSNKTTTHRNPIPTVINRVSKEEKKFETEFGTRTYNQLLVETPPAVERYFDEHPQEILTSSIFEVKAGIKGTRLPWDKGEDMGPYQISIQFNRLVGPKQDYGNLIGDIYVYINPIVIAKVTQGDAARFGVTPSKPESDKYRLHRRKKDFIFIDLLDYNESEKTAVNPREAIIPFKGNYPWDKATVWIVAGPINLIDKLPDYISDPVKKEQVKKEIERR